MKNKRSGERLREGLSLVFGGLSDLAAVAVPSMLYIYILLHAGSLSIPALHLYLGKQQVLILVVVLFASSMILVGDYWFEWFPFNVLYHLLPIGVFCLFYLAQGNFFLAAAVTGIYLIFLVLLVIFLHTRDWKMKEILTFFRRAAFLGVMMLQIPVMALVFFHYGFRNTHMTIAQSALEDDREKLDSLLSEHSEQIERLKEAEWRKLSREEKTACLQALADVMCGYLDAGEVKVKAGELEGRTLGTFSERDRLITIRTGHMETDPSLTVAETLCHEVRHAYQDAVIDMLDWNDEQVKYHYFYREARLWKAEKLDYTDGESDESFMDYYLQHGESDARAFGRYGASLIQSYLGDEETREAYIRASEKE